MTVKIYKHAAATSACGDMAAAMNLGYSAQRLAAQLQNPSNRLPRIRPVEPIPLARVRRVAQQNGSIRTLGIRPHPHRKLIKNPQEAQVGWMVGDAFIAWGSCKNESALGQLIADVNAQHGAVKVVDLR